jgi:hypothetical protein
MLKKILFIAFLGVMLMPAPAQAVDIFNKPKSAEAPAEPEPAPPSAQPDLPELQAPEPAAPAEPKDIKEAANSYYKFCMSKQNPMLDAENQKLLCGCTASNIPDVMTLEQMKAMNTDTAEGLEQRNRMLLFVYTPCIEYPTRSMVLYQCMGNEQLKTTLGNPTKICNCLADGMATFMRERAPDAIQMAIRRNEKDIDPLRKLMESNGYEQYQNMTLRNCLAASGVQ